MAKTIAVTGKGGTGKTAVASMVLRALLDADQKPILAVDADPNANFHTALGLELDMTVGGIRESEIEQKGLIPPGMSKPEYFELRTRQALVESRGFDFLSMGRPEGPGCYCFPNSMLRAALDHVGKDYKWIVVDCEAGLEHFSRRTTGSIDLLIVLSDISRRGLDTVRHVLDLADSLGTPVKHVRLAVNRCPDEVPEPTIEATEALDLDVDIWLPDDPEITRRDLHGDPLLTVPNDAVLLTAVRELLASFEPETFRSSTPAGTGAAGDANAS